MILTTFEMHRHLRAEVADAVRGGVTPSEELMKIFTISVGDLRQKLRQAR